MGSGNDLCRDGLEKIRELVRKKQIEGVLVWKIDRLSRNLKHLLILFEEFQQNEVSFISIQENIDFSGPIGRLIFQMFGAIAQFERELIRGRTYAGKLTSAEQGNYVGGMVPYGYRRSPNKEGKGSKLEIIPEEKKWVQQIYDWYVYQQWGDLKIANELNRLKVPLGKGGRKSKQVRWTERRVWSLLPNPIYFGRHVAIKKDENGKILIESEQTIVSVPACISETMFRQAAKARENRTGGFSKNIYLLSGKLRDISPELPNPRCFVGVQRTKGGYSYRRKRYKNLDSDTYCSTLEIPGKPLDDFVWQRILSAFENPTEFINKYLQIQQHGSNHTEKLELKLKTLRKRELEIAEIEHPNLEQALIRGTFDDDQYKDQHLRLSNELHDIQSQIQNLESDLEGIIWAKEEVNNIKQASKDILKKLENLNHEQKNILCDLFIDRVEICKTDHEQKKREIKADIFFRFNPSNFNDSGEGVRTCEPQSPTGSKGNAESENNSGGGRGGSGYIPIVVSASFRKAEGLNRHRQAQTDYSESRWYE